MVPRCVLFPVLLATLAFAFEALADMKEVMPDGRAPPSPITLVKARCIFCHGPTLMLGFSRRMLDQGGKDALNAFLAEHHAPDAAARAAIVDFLAAPMEASGS